MTSPLLSDALLGKDLPVTLVGTPEKSYARFYGSEVSASELRQLADEIERMEKAVASFFFTEEVDTSKCSYAVGYFDCNNRIQRKIITDRSIEEILATLAVERSRVFSIVDNTSGVEVQPEDYKKD